MGILDSVMSSFLNTNKNRNEVTSTFGGSYIDVRNAGTTKISEDEAMSISAVAASTDIISSTIARLPIEIYKIDSNGEKIILDDDNRRFLLNKEPNSLMSGINLKKRIATDYLLYGSSYLYPEWNRNELIGIHHIEAKNIQIKKLIRRDKPFIVDGEIEIKNGAGQIVGNLSPDELVIILKNTSDGLTSKGILELNSDLLTLALRQQSYSSALLENGSLPLSILKVPTKLTDRALQNIKHSWAGNYGGAGNAGKTVILEDGIEHEAVSLNPNELELTASKKTTLSDIARVFNIPESMINAESNKYNSNEQNNIHLLQYTLSPIISSIENALERSLLLEKEKREGYRIKFVTDDILITTEREKFESTIQALKGGIINISEARRRHGYKNIKDNYFMWSIGTVLYNADSRMMTLPNMGVSLDPNNLEQVSELNGNNALNDKLDNKVKVDSEEEDSEEPDNESEDEETDEKEDLKEEEIDEDSK